MSFSSEVKEELSHVDGHENHCMIAELAAIIGLCGKIKCEDGRYSLILHTENVSVARRFYSLIKIFSKITPSLFTIKEGSTSLPKPFSPQGTRDVAGSAIAPPEFWYRKRSLCPKGLAESAYAIK